MPSGIMRVEKRGRAAVYGLQIEANRQPADHEKRDFDRSDIDWSRTGENVSLVRTENWNREITRQIHAAGLKERKDSIVLLDGLYTASPGFFDGKSKEYEISYFRACLKFHVEQYCGGDSSRVINAVVHFDEKTPHLQVASVPLVRDGRGMHLSAKIVMGGRDAYRSRQDRFFEDVGRRFGLQRGEIHDPTEIKAHISKRDWQLAEQERKTQELEQRGQDAVKLLDRSSAHLEAAQARPALMSSLPGRRDLVELPQKSLENLAAKASLGDDYADKAWRAAKSSAEAERASREALEASKKAQAEQKAADLAARRATALQSGEAYLAEKQKLEQVKRERQAARREATAAKKEADAARARADAARAEEAASRTQLAALQQQLADIREQLQDARYDWDAFQFVLDHHDEFAEYRRQLAEREADLAANYGEQQDRQQDLDQQQDDDLDFE